MLKSLPPISPNRGDILRIIPSQELDLRAHPSGSSPVAPTNGVLRRDEVPRV